MADTTLTISMAMASGITLGTPIGTTAQVITHAHILTSYTLTSIAIANTVAVQLGLIAHIPAFVDPISLVDVTRVLDREYHDLVHLLVL